MGTPSEFDCITKQSDGYPLVLRPEIAEIIQAIDESNEKLRFNLSFYAFLAQYCKLKEWLVLYFPCIAHIHNYCLLYVKIVSFIQTVRKHELIEIPFLNEIMEDLLANKKQEKVFQQVTELIKCLSCNRSRPTAILVDQWNLVIKEPNNELAKFLSCFDDVCQSEKGAFFAALSSQANSGLPISAFRDASKITYKMTLNPFSEAALISFIMMRTNELKKSEFDMLKTETNYIPRLLTWGFCMKNGMTCIASRQEFRKKAIEYYKTRMTSFITKEGIGKKGNKYSIGYIAASIYLNKKIYGAVESLWTDSGLLVEIEGEQEYDAPCPSARLAIYEQTKSQSIDLITFLATDEATKGLGIELLFASSFSNTDNKTVTMKTYDNSEITFTVNSIDYQPLPKNGIYLVKDIPLGQLVICHANHSIVDFVIHSNNKIFFIQLSFSQHSHHKSKMNPDLWKKTIKVKHNTKEEDLSVLNYYQKCCGLQMTQVPNDKCECIYLCPLQYNPKHVKHVKFILGKSNFIQLDNTRFQLFDSTFKTQKGISNHNQNKRKSRPTKKQNIKKKKNTAEHLNQ